MSLPIPRKKEDITKQWLQDMLECQCGSVDITSFTLEPLGKGDGFTSQLFAAHVDAAGRNKEALTYDLIIKILPALEWQLDMISEMHIFQKEIIMYTEIIPAMIACQKQDGPKILPHVPKCYYGQFHNKEGVLVLQNENVNGYEMVDVQVGFNREQTEEVLRAFAVFHALGYNLLKTSGDTFSEKYPSVALCPWKSMKDMIEPILEKAVEILESIPGQEGNMEKMKTSSGKVFERMMKIMDSKKPIAVLGHGDCWINNMLFKKDGVETQKAMLLDLQVGFCGPPTVDLAEVIASSVQAEVQCDLEKILQVYYKTFMETLAKLEVTADFSFDDLLTSYKANFFSGFVKCTGIVQGYGFYDKSELLTAMDNVEGSKLTDVIKQFDEEFKIEGKQFKVQAMKERFLKVIEDSIEFGVFPV